MYSMYNQSGSNMFFFFKPKGHSWWNRQTKTRAVAVAAVAAAVAVAGNPGKIDAKACAKPECKLSCRFLRCWKFKVPWLEMKTWMIYSSGGHQFIVIRTYIYIQYIYIVCPWCLDFEYGKCWTLPGWDGNPFLFTTAQGVLASHLFITFVSCVK